MKYLDFYNLIFTKNNLNGYIAFGESINNGSFLGGLSRFILKNKDLKIFNCTNAEYTHIGIGFGIALGGGKAIYVCK